MNKQKVTLSLDPIIYQRTKDSLQLLPGKPSVSSLVDELLDGFTKTLSGPIQALAAGSTPADAYTLLMQTAMTEIIRTLQEEDE